MEIRNAAGNSNASAKTINRNGRDDDVPSAMDANNTNDERRNVSPTGDKPFRSTEHEAEKSQPRFKKMWSKLGLDVPTILMMFK
jgi:hypothetical protein